MTIKVTRSLATAIIGLCALAMTSPAMAARHFSFEVPIQFDLVASAHVERSRVYCEAHSAADMSDATLIGRGKDDGLRGTDSPSSKATAFIEFDADAGKDPRQASHYRCYLEVKNGDDWCIPGLTENPPQWCTPANETDTPVVSGAF